MADQNGAATGRPNAFATDIRRTVTSNPKRFISLFIITLLGATMLVGLRAACEDLRATADAFFDSQHLYDIQVQSTLGLDDDDIAALSKVDGVAGAEGAYEQDACIDIKGDRVKVELTASSGYKVNRPLIIDGDMPRDPSDIVVTRSFADASGLKVGGTVSFEDMSGNGAGGSEGDGNPIFENRIYTITGIALDPSNVNGSDSAMSFRSGSQARYTFFLADTAVTDPGTFTAAYLRVDGADSVSAFSDAYQEKVDAVSDEVERGREGWQEARTERVKDAARERLEEERSKSMALASLMTSGQLAEARAQTEDAEAEIDAIEPATWYVRDRTANASLASIDSDASSIEAIAAVFPIIFFLVAVLISSTTATRMVEEDRGLIGLYKALGYSRARILSKYLLYSLAACVAGGLAGDLIGFTVLPRALFTIFDTMYSLPSFSLVFDPAYALAGVGLFAAGVAGATFLSCRHVLRESPASLMRPRAPQAGKRILLERIGPVWRRMGFLNKVSARNLFRYKKRFLMTVLGIAGCTALMICGLGIRDSVIALKPREYGDAGIMRYDLIAVTSDTGFEDGRAKLEGDGDVEDVLEARIDSATAEYGGAKESLQLVVVPDGSDLSKYISTDDAVTGEHLDLPGSGPAALVTKNAEQVLGFTVGDELSVQDSTLRTASVRIDGVTMNYLGNYLFMNESAYREAFGQDAARNAFLANLDLDEGDQIGFAEDLAEDDAFASVTSTAETADSFSENFKIIDIVVLVLAVMAALLAFAVVFTLSNTNISERERELATIKVLGFRKGEVHAYINKETVVLTVVGIAAGCPLGLALTRMITFVLRMPSLYFDTVVEPGTYLIAGAMSLVFTLVINKVTDRTLDRIDMVGALKSAE